MWEHEGPRALACRAAATLTSGTLATMTKMKPLTKAGGAGGKQREEGRLRAGGGP
jgi:hypothetical protein